VAGEAEVEAERGEIVGLRQQVQRPRQAQVQLVAIERHAFDGLEDLGEVDRRAPHLGGDLGQGPATGRIGAKHKLGAVGEPTASRRPADGAAGARSESAAGQGEGETLGLQRLEGAGGEAVAELGGQRLGLRVDAAALVVEGQGRARRSRGWGASSRSTSGSSAKDRQASPPATG
jgi:hypothetical protein